MSEEIFKLEELIKETAEETKEESFSFDFNSINQFLENLNKLLDKIEKFRTAKTQQPIQQTQNNNTITITKEELAKKIITFLEEVVNRIDDNVTIKEVKEQLKQQKEQLYQLLLQSL